MALSFVLAGTGTPDAADPTLSVTAAAGDLIIVALTFYTSSTVGPPTGAGLTFTDIGGGASNDTVLYGAVVGGGGFSGTLTIHAGIAFCYTVGVISGANTSTPIVQVKAGSGSSNPTAINYTGAFASPSNGGFAVFVTSTAGTPTPRSGWTIESHMVDGFSRNHNTEFRATSDTASGMDFGGSVGWDMIAVEIAVAGGGGGGASGGMYHHLQALGVY